MKFVWYALDGITARMFLLCWTSTASELQILAPKNGSSSLRETPVAHRSAANQGAVRAVPMNAEMLLAALHASGLCLCGPIGQAWQIGQMKKFLEISTDGPN